MQHHRFRYEFDDDDGRFDMRGVRAVVMGLGRFGGGVGLTQWLVARGATVVISDTASESELADSLAELRHERRTGRVLLQLGGHAPAHLDRADVVYANPAVKRPWANAFLREAHRRGIPVETEIGLAMSMLEGDRPIVAVTGTSGKSTTAAMTAHAIERTGPLVVLGGNIGGTLLDPDTGGIDSQDDDEQIVYVLELSSAMLYWLRRVRGLELHATAITNIVPNHLDWHGRWRHYLASKLHILEMTSPNGTVIVSEQVAELIASMPHMPQRRLEIITPEDAKALPELTCPGEHNRLNAAMARALAQTVVDADNPLYLDQALAGFPGLPHRLEKLKRTGPIACYNDSKCTTPEATSLAVNAIRETHPGARIHLIAGGADKGVDLSPLARLGDELYTIGATAQAIAAARTHHAGSPAHACGTLDAAVRTIASVIAAAPEPADRHVVLLSPGCASWDQFANYEKRGEQFAALCQKTFGRSPRGPAPEPRS